MNERRDDDEESGSGLTGLSRPADAETDLDDARRVILARRARFVALALASAGIAAGCGGETDGDTEQTTGSGGMQATGGGPQVCLEPPITGGAGGSPQVCLSGAGGGIGGSVSTGGTGGTPQVCLGATPPDAGFAGSGGTTGAGGTGGATGAGGAGGLPQVCLGAPYEPPDSGSSDSSA